VIRRAFMPRLSRAFEDEHFTAYDGRKIGSRSYHRFSFND